MSHLRWSSLVGMTLMTGVGVATWIKVIQLNWEKLSADAHWKSFMVLLFMVLPLIGIWKDLGWGHPKEVCESKARELSMHIASMSGLLLAIGLTLFILKPLLQQQLVR